MEQVSILWQRGAKLQYSKPAPVYEGCAEWEGQVLKQARLPAPSIPQLPGHLPARRDHTVKGRRAAGASLSGLLAAQTATMYRDGPAFVAKPYVLKVQAAEGPRARAATVARCTVDLACLCACSPAGARSSLCLPLKCAPCPRASSSLKLCKAQPCQRRTA